MKLDRKKLIIGAAVLVAAAAGHTVQNSEKLFGSARASDVAASEPAEQFEFQNVAPLSASAEKTAGALPVFPHAPEAAPQLGAPAHTEMTKRIEGLDAGQESMPKQIADQQLNQFGMACETALTASAAPSAMVQLDITATCSPDERVEILHNRLVFATRLSNTGTVSVQVPALDGAATFLVRMADGSVQRAFVQMPEARDFERVVLQSDGQGLMELHAYEFGANYGEDGHVWAQSPRDPEFATQGKGGFLTVLGDASVNNPMLAQIYSHPRDQALNSEVVRVSVELPITKDNCATDLAAETIQPGADGALQTTALTLAAPGCDGIGEFLVLKNVVRDLKIAAN